MDLSGSPLARGVELHARLDDVDAAVERCRRLGAADEGTVERTATWFTLGKYRLRLVESSDGAHFLVGGSIADGTGPVATQSRRRAVENPGAVKATLARQWGVKAVVGTTRRTFLWRGRVRVHLDRVAGLGDFLAFQADVDAAGGYVEEVAFLDVAHLAREFGVTERDVVAESYVALLAGARTTPSGT